ncbi:MAG: hypothetical protein U0992_11915 [Planctomycetaceae bacterium]
MNSQRPSAVRAGLARTLIEHYEWSAAAGESGAFVLTAVPRDPLRVCSSAAWTSSSSGGPRFRRR